MKKKYKYLTVITLYAIFGLLYIVFFLLRIDSPPLFLFLTIGSVAILSSSTIYTVIESQSSQYKRIKSKKYLKRPELIQKKTVNIFEDYFEAMPSIEEYIESSDSYKDMEVIDKFVFSVFSQEEIENINLLELSKIDKIMFIREILYFDADERRNLIKNMLKNKGISNEEIKYSPPLKLIELGDQIRVYVRSLVEPGEKTKIIILNTTELIGDVKEKISILFDYKLENFLLSSGGILLQEDTLLNSYDIDDDDEIALIPSRKK
ncbi:MAG: ubiquitin-like domain-containing protein [Promethearchaeota archaeon]